MRSSDNKLLLWACLRVRVVCQLPLVFLAIVDSFLARKLFSVGIISTFAFSSTFAQEIFWEQANGPYGGTINTLAFGPRGEIFVGTNGGGIFRTTDRGELWKPVIEGLGSLFVGKIAMGPGGELYAIVEDRSRHRTKLYVSENDAINWESRGESFFNNQDIDYIEVSNQGHVFVSSTTQILQSLDKGRTWDISFEDTLNQRLSSIVTHLDRYIFALTSEGTILRSADNGGSWTSHMLSAPVTHLAVGNDGHLYVGTTKVVDYTITRGISQSQDLGESWTEIFTSQTFSPGGSRAVLTDLATRKDGTILAVYKLSSVFVSGYRGSYIERSKNGGQSWEKILDFTHTGFVDPDTTIGPITIDNKGEIFVITSQGVFCSGDIGDTWKVLGQVGLINIGVTVVTADYDGHFFAGTGRGLFRSSNVGLTWESLNNSLPAKTLFSLAVDSQGEIFAGTEIGLYRSADHGLTWVDAGLDKTVICMAFNSQGHIYCGGSADIYRSQDEGRTWISLDHAGAKSLAITSNDQIYAWIGSASGSIHRSLDNGENWQFVHISGGHLAVDSIDHIYAAGTYMSRSSDGESWTTFFDWPRDATALAINQNDEIYVSNASRNVFKSTYQGEIWNPINHGLWQTQVSSFAFAPDGRILAGTLGAGVFLRDERRKSNMVPIALLLEQAYPNPFNQGTTIEFSLLGSGYVILKVYNIVGQEVSTLVSDTLPTGRHQVAWNPGDLATGTYFCRLQSGSLAQTMKILLVR